MLFQRSVSPIISKTRGTVSKTPTKSPIRKQKQQTKLPGTKNHKSVHKTKQATSVLYMLEEIYSNLNFNEFDAFPKENIEQARVSIQKLYKYLKQQPVCSKHPSNVLSLYCQKEKQLLCVECFHGKNNEHKGHSVKTLERVQKSIQYETIRNSEKNKQLINQLSIIHDQIDELSKEISQIYMNINNNSLNIINETIRQLQAIKEEYDNKLSLAYRRTNTIIRRYNESLQDIISIVSTNTKKAQAMGGLSKYILLKEINKQSALMQDLISRFNENRMLMQQWKRSQKDSEKIMAKKKVSKYSKEDTHTVTQF